MKIASRPTAAPADLFSLRRSIDRERQPFRAAAAGVLDRALALDKLSRLYADAATLDPERPFVDRALTVLQASYDLPEADRLRIPASGPLVVVANHSFGAVEGLMLLSILRSVRPDVRVLANYMLRRIPDMCDSCIFVDPFGAPGAPRGNARPLREALRWLRQGGVLGVFPSGEVAHWDLRQRAVAEPPWNETIGGIIRAAKVPALPVYFSGANSPLFHVLGLMHPRLRTAMLPRQLYNKRNHCVPVRVGRLVPFARLARCASDRARMDYLRTRTYLLEGRAQSAPNEPANPVRQWFRVKQPPPVAPAAAPETLAAEVATLPETQRLVSGGDLEIWHARTPQIPAMLREIGRLREATFRAVGEGCGRALDLDRFDPYYQHLFLWNRARRELVGAYRIGATDEILPQFGRAGLYTSTLFKFDRRLLKSLTPALELGRSFVRQEYQRSYQALYLIWRGIATFVLQRPHYRILFGPVSISSQYRSISRHLMVEFLRMNESLPEWAGQVRPRKPVRGAPFAQREALSPARVATSLAELEEFIADVEPDLEGAPILLKQYLKLGGKFLEFNRDPKFSDCLDGLILVDLVEANHKVLGRYMGTEGLARYLAHHGVASEAAANAEPSTANLAP